MLVVLQTVLDSEEWRNLALSKEIARRGHDFIITVHSARHLRFFKKAGIGQKCIFCQNKIALAVKKLLQSPRLLENAIQKIHETITPSDLERACRDDYIFIEKSKTFRHAHFAAVFNFYDDLFNDLLFKNSNKGLIESMQYVSEMGYLYRHAAEMAAVKNGLEPLLIESARIPGRIAFLDRNKDYNWKGLASNWETIKSMTIKDIEKTFPDQILEAREFLHRFDNKGMVIASDGWSDTRKISIKKMLNSVNYVIRHFFEEKTMNPYTDFIVFLNKSLKRKILSAIFNIKSLTNIIYSKEKTGSYAFFPLPVPWETTIRWRAPGFDNHLKSIKMVRDYLPKNIQLFVKEHPVDIGGTPIKDLIKISRIKGVTLLSPSVDSRTLIKKAKIVITVNGTAGLEAIFFNKRPITLAPAFYEVLGMSERADISKRHVNFQNFQAQDNHRALKVVTAMILSSEKAHFDYSTGPEFKKYMKKKNIKIIVNAILKGHYE